MDYKGKLYGKIGNKYFDTSYTSDDWDRLNNENTELKKQCAINGVVKSLPIDEIQDYHIKRWANGLENGASMQEIRDDMVIAKKAIDLGNTLKEREIK